MPDLDARRREALAAVVPGAALGCCVDCPTNHAEDVANDQAREIAAALAPLIAGWLAEAEAAALREAADEWQTGAWTVLTPPIKAPTQPQRIIGAAQAVTDWLRDRADRIGGAS